MRVVEVRRHSIRESGPHLSDAGRQLAAAVRYTMASAYDLVLTSDKPRARETAEIMGFAVDVQDAAFGVFSASGIVDYGAAFHDPRGREALRAHGAQYMDAVRSYLPRVPEGGRVLLISHGGTMEHVAARFTAEFSLEALGGPFAPCEGFSLHFDPEGRVLALDFHRLVRT